MTEDGQTTSLWITHHLTAVSLALSSTNRTQMVPGEQAGVVLVGPADAECVIAAEGDVDQAEVDGDAFGIEQLFSRQFVDTDSTATFLTHGPERQARYIVVIPDKFQHALLFVDSNVLW